MRTFILGLWRLILEYGRNQAAEAREVIPTARRVVRKRAIVWHILKNARHAQFALGIALIVLLFVASPVVDTVTSTIFPGQSSQKLFGLIKNHGESRIKGFIDPVIMTILWLSSLGWISLQLWLYIPRGLAKAEDHSRKLALEAKWIERSQRTRCTELYRHARDLTLDPEAEDEITAKLEELGGGLAPHVSQRPTVADTRPPSNRSGKIRVQVNPADNAVGHDGRYRLEAEMGKGSMGEVFRGWDCVLDREVALKQLSIRLSDDESYADRFRQEARALARLTHPNIVQVYDFVEEEHRLWMVLELVDGGDLEAYLAEHGRLNPSEAALITHQAATGLAHAHAAGIVHRDLKPANILLTPAKQVKISDFGIAKLSRSTNLTQEGSVLGSPPYMSPEQACGAPVDTRTDIYSLGITLYEMLTGQVPFDGDTSSVLAKHIIEAPKPPSECVPSLPPLLEQIVLHMLAKKVDDRPKDMTTVAKMLDDHLIARTLTAATSRP